MPALPIAAFSMAEPPCNGLDIAFDNLSSDADGYQWVFDLGDPTTGIGPESTSASPTWSYGGFGSFDAQLIAQPGEACADTTVETVTVLPEDPPHHGLWGHRAPGVLFGNHGGIPLQR